MRNNMLEDALYNYIKEHQEDNNIDSVDILHAFPKCRPDSIAASLTVLRIQKRIERVNLGIHYKYITL
jgi:hypothetical protein